MTRRTSLPSVSFFTVRDLAFADPAVKKLTEGKEVRRVIFVPNRLLNIVV